MVPTEKEVGGVGEEDLVAEEASGVVEASGEGFVEVVGLINSVGSLAALFVAFSTVARCQNKHGVLLGKVFLLVDTYYALSESDDTY